MRRAKHRLLGQLRFVTLLSAAAIVAGCSGLPSISGTLPSWFSSSPDRAAAQSSPSSDVVTARTLDEDCPGMDIRTGAGTILIAAKSQQATANDLRYQLSFTELARQCFVEGGNVRIRAGVQGRVVVGPAGAPPRITVPVRYAVVQEGVQPKTIVTKFRRFEVTLPPGSGNVPFTDIEDELTFPMPPTRELQAYVVYVGFDSAVEQPKALAKKKSQRKRLERSVAPVPTR